MNRKVLEAIDQFIVLKIPRYIESQIQKCALNHLEMKDMGQLRDRMEGQAYYDKLKKDILAEFAFEKLLGLNKFDWNKRENKGYKRKQYCINNVSVKLVVFSDNALPRISLVHLYNYIFVYVNSDQRIYISGLMPEHILVSQLTAFTKINKKNSSIVDFSNFNDTLKFENLDELSKLL